MWARPPIVKVAMGCRTEPATIHIVHVLQKLHSFNFSIFFTIYTIYRKRNEQFLFIIYTTYRKKRNYTTYRQEKELHDLTIVLYTSYIFHLKR